MAFINAFGSTGADKDIFIVIGHADDFVRHDLPDRQDQIKSALDQKIVDLCGPARNQLYPANLSDK